MEIWSFSRLPHRRGWETSWRWRMRERPSFLTRLPGVCWPLQARASDMVLWTRTEARALAQEIRTTTPTATSGATKGARIAEDAPHKAGAQEVAKITVELLWMRRETAPRSRCMSCRCDDVCHRSPYVLINDLQWIQELKSALRFGRVG